MTVYVDEAIFAWSGKMWCHMFADDVGELHAFTGRLWGSDRRTAYIYRKWFQCPPKASWEHYDISEPTRRRALKLGATPVDRYFAVNRERQRRGQPPIIRPGQQGELDL